MTLHVRVYSIYCFFCCVFALSFLVTTLVSLPYFRPDQVETLLAFKNEFSTCNSSVTSSWTEDTATFEGVVFDGETEEVSELHLGDACLSGSLKANSSLFRFQHLRYLDLSLNDFSSSIPAEFGRLTNLESLDLHHNDFTGEIPSSICNLSHLTSLDLSINKLSGGFPLIHNLTELYHLNLFYNNFSGTIPSYLFAMPSLVVLELHQNHFNGPLYIPSLNSSYALETLNLGNNLFSGQILEPISNLLNLIYLDLSFLNITFPLNFTFLSFESLEYLDISGNNVSRLNISSDHVIPITLIELHLSSCNIYEFPKNLKTLTYLQHLDISNNRLNGKVPEWLWNLPCLTAVRLSHNSINGFEGPQDVLLNSLLLVLDFSSNAFHGSFPIIIPRSMEFLSASNNNFTEDIPGTLCDLKFLNVLDLSNNGFSGFIPPCFSESLQVLNLSNNNLEGSISGAFFGSSSLTTVDVGHNQISGKLPRSLEDCIGLEILNVESNNIRDTFPYWLKTLPNLHVIVLRSNKFFGSISSPKDPLSFPELRIIDISHNQFTGSLPPNYFVDWSAPLISMPKGDHYPKYMVHLGYQLPNYFEGSRKNTYLLDIGWPSYFSMHLRNKGLNRELEKISVTYTAIDFSGNRLGGQIPESIGLLKSLIVLDLSNNSFTGHIPSSLAKLKQLESLDLSRNQLSGKIPQELTVLTFLGYIDMSYNKLTGQIPQSTQIVGQSNSSFEGNTDLCGLPLQEICFRENGAPSPELPKQEPMLNWKAVAIGYGPGVMFGLAIGQVIASYRSMWFIKLLFL
ncbi:Receptor-like protein 54 [Cardamine amara subsp. amara]|uniref:Receptor-like protein 54 n=1 Tax=Cardamine amara subsp. amara TaxID=228776 RepID=A0ABD1B021_CARAN